MVITNKKGHRRQFLRWPIPKSSLKWINREGIHYLVKMTYYMQAEKQQCTCSELLQSILENTYPQEIAKMIPLQEQPETNLISSQAYGKSNGRSQEQIKVYCRNHRLPGAIRIGRDWVLPRDTRFPEDHRKRGAK